MVQNNVSSSNGFTLIEVLVALSLLALGVAGIAQLRYSAYRHISVTHEIQEATYFADSHLNTLIGGNDAVAGFQSGEYLRSVDTAVEEAHYPWELNLTPLSDAVLQPESSSLSTKVLAMRADLSVWVDQGARELRFHTLLLLEPEVEETPTRPSFSLGAKP